MRATAARGSDHASGHTPQVEAEEGKPLPKRSVTKSDHSRGTPQQRGELAFEGGSERVQIDEATPPLRDTWGLERGPNERQGRALEPADEPQTLSDEPGRQGGLGEGAARVGGRGPAGQVQVKRKIQRCRKNNYRNEAKYASWHEEEEREQEGYHDNSKEGKKQKEQITSRTRYK